MKREKSSAGGHLNYQLMQRDGFFFFFFKFCCLSVRYSYVCFHSLTEVLTFPPILRCPSPHSSRFLPWEPLILIFPVLYGLILLRQIYSIVSLLFISFHSCTILKIFFLLLFLCITIYVWWCLFSFVHLICFAFSMLLKSCSEFLVTYFTVIYLFPFKWLFVWFKVILYNE